MIVCGLKRQKSLIQACVPGALIGGTVGTALHESRLARGPLKGGA